MLTDATPLQVEKRVGRGSELVSFLAVAQRVRPLFFAPWAGKVPLSSFFFVFPEAYAHYHNI